MNLFVPESIQLETANNIFSKIKNFKVDSNFLECFLDVIQGSQKFGFYWAMAVSDIRKRYRRTLLGPFWTTLNLSIFIGFIGLLFSRLWKTDLYHFMPYFASGFICWVFISTIITEGCATFIAAENLIKQLPWPYTVYAWHVVFRNLLVLAHHALVYLVIVFAFNIPLNANSLLIIPALLLITFTSVWVVLLIGLCCARYRDLQQVVQSLVQISIFITPILWPVSQLENSGRAVLFMDFNLLYHYISIMRLPLLGEAPSAYNWFIVLATTCIGWLITLVVFTRTRRMLPFWV